MWFPLAQFPLTQVLAYEHVVEGFFFVLVELLEQSHLREFCVIRFFLGTKIHKSWASQNFLLFVTDIRLVCCYRVSWQTLQLCYCLFLCESMNFHPDKQLFQGAGIKPLTLGLQSQCSTPTPQGTHCLKTYGCWFGLASQYWLIESSFGPSVLKEPAWAELFCTWLQGTLRLLRTFRSRWHGPTLVI